MHFGFYHQLLLKYVRVRGKRNKKTWFRDNFFHIQSFEQFLNSYQYFQSYTSFTLRISWVNVTKSAVSCGFGHIYRRNPEWKTSIFMQCTSIIGHVPIFILTISLAPNIKCIGNRYFVSVSRICICLNDCIY